MMDLSTKFGFLSNLKYCLVICLLNLGFFVSAQVKVDFKPRISNKAAGKYKGKTIYHLKGDFAMIGNTNLTLVNYAETGDAAGNNNAMMFVNKYLPKQVKNSSLATLNLPSSCSEIIYAGLYWTGRADVGNATMTVNGLRKDQVKLAKFGQPYTQITANSLTNGASEIYYPGGDSNYMYVGYADVTDYVKANGAGQYAVGDIALTEGQFQTGTKWDRVNGRVPVYDGTGYYGGWGMVIVYADPTLPVRDISVFDGYGYMVGNKNTSSTLKISGFQTTHNGNVNATLGVMAGEGDVNISGDYFQIQGTDGTYTSLSHGNGTEQNFFNSSIIGNSGLRTPGLLNNTGIDISRLTIPSTNENNKKIIANDQSDVTFRFGSTQDTYIIYNIVFAVDAYYTDVQGLISGNDNGNGLVVNNGDKVDPGQDYGMKLEIYNKGSEAVTGTKATVNIPYNQNYVDKSAQITGGTDFTNNTVVWVPPVGAPVGATPDTTPGGTLVWDIGTLPLHANKDDLLGTLTWSVRASNDCTILLTQSCSTAGGGTAGDFSGNGQITGGNVNNGFITGYDNTCHVPVAGDFEVGVNITDAFRSQCRPKVVGGVNNYYADSNFYPRSGVVPDYLANTKFYNQMPDSYNSTDGLITGDFPAPSSNETVLTYYAVYPGMADGCFLILQVHRDACYNPANKIGTAKDTTVGISLLNRTDVGGGQQWPMVRKGGAIALESNQQGLVLSRFSTTDLTKITNPQEGMMVYDTTAKCLKIYTDGSWKCFDQPACP